MGVHGLWPIIQPTASHTPLDDLRGLRLAIDLAIWVVDDMQTQREAVCVIPGKLHLRNLLFRTLHLLKLGAKPLFILDGKAPLLKVQTMMARAGRQGGRAGAKTVQAAAAVDPERIRKRAKFRRLLSGDCCRLLDLLGVPHVESPGEAESMAALLNSRGIVDAVVTNDGDAFLYGAVRVLRNFSMDSRDAHVDLFDSGRLASQLGLTRDRLVALALLLGCDFAPGGTPGVGPALALKFFRSLPPDVDAASRLLDAAVGGGMDDGGCGVLRRFVAASAGCLAAAPAIVAEFVDANRNWPLVEPQLVTWRRPRPLELVRFCLDRLEWAEEYAVAKLLPLLLVWDEAAGQASAPMIGPRPRRVLAERVRSGVPCYEVEFHKLDFDIWTEAEFYTLCVPRHPFGELHADLVTGFAQLRLEEKENKQKAKKLQQQQQQQKKKQKKPQAEKQQLKASLEAKIDQFFLPQPPAAPIRRRRSVLVDSLSDLFADISLASPAAEPISPTKENDADDVPAPFSRLFDFRHRHRPSLASRQFRIDSSLLLTDSPVRSSTGDFMIIGRPASEPAPKTALASAPSSAPASAPSSAAASAPSSAAASAPSSAAAFASSSAAASAPSSTPASALSSAPTSADPLPPAAIRLEDSFDLFETPPRLATRLQLLYNNQASQASRPAFLD